MLPFRSAGLIGSAYASAVAAWAVPALVAVKAVAAVRPAIAVRNDRRCGCSSHRRTCLISSYWISLKKNATYGRKDIVPRISAMAREIIFFVYPGFVLLDLCGPLEALTSAAEMVPDSYRLTVVSLTGGAVRSSTGLSVMTTKTLPARIDTVVTVGDFGLAERPITAAEIGFVRTASSRARRTASVCMGAFVLAASGLLDGRKATTHWRYAAKLQASYPKIRVNGDRIFVHDGHVWTSAGMTAGIDMILALIEDDLGKETSRAVARMLVVYYRRSGEQDQYSSLLDLDSDSNRIRNALLFAREHLSKPLSVETLAEASRLSVRQFSRTFVAATGTTPAKAVERLRVEAAQPRVEEGRETLDVVARSTGFGDPERMRQSFVRILGVTPQALRRRARTA
jgi:transcriptional regulator GlxA family with amidase domain